MDGVGPVELLLRSQPPGRLAQRLKQLLEHLPVGLYVADSHGSPVYRNRAAAELLGLAEPAITPQGDPVAHRYYRAGTGNPYPVSELPVARALAGEAAEVNDLEVEHPHRGRVRLRAWAAPLLGAGGRVAFAVVAFADVTVESLLDRVLEQQARAAERERIAEDIHDDVLQLLATARLQLGGLHLRGMEQATSVEAVDTLMSEAVLRLRLLLAGLKPRSSDELRLADALRLSLAPLAAVGVEVRVEDHLSSGLGEPAGSTLRSVCEEAIANIRKHAGATRTSVTLVHRGGGVEASVVDNGLGFEPGQARRSGHLGMTLMQERVWRIGGRLRIDTAPGQGTSVTVWVPDPAAEQAWGGEAPVSHEPGAETQRAEEQRLSAARPLTAEPAALHGRGSADEAVRPLTDPEVDEWRERVLSMALERTGADAVILLEIGAAGHPIAVLAQRGLPRSLDLRAAPGDLELVRSHQTSVVSRGDGRSTAVSELLRAEGFRAGLAAGLGVHGVDQLLLAARRYGRFGAAAGPVLRESASVLAAVQRQRHLAHTAEKRVSQQAAVASLGQAALASDVLPELAQAACEAAAANLDAEMVSVLERVANGLVVRAGIGLPDSAAVGTELTLEESFSWRVMRSDQPLLIPDMGNDSQFQQTLLARVLRNGSLLVVPIRSERRTIGTLTVVSRSPAAYTEDDVGFVQGLANVVALAAERAHVQGQLRLSVEELRKSAEDRQHLLAHVVDAQEEERRRIADDIHDDSVQVMTAVALRLTTLRRRLGEDKLDPLLVNLEGDVQRSITRLRHLMFVLRPPALEDQGIAAALEAYLAIVTEDTGLSYSVEDRVRLNLETETRIVAYRIAQEAVANVCKHAHASRLEVTLDEAEAGGVLVTIRDDGIGFKPERPPQARPLHMGLMVMRERAEQSGGWCVVESHPGRGTTVRYCVGGHAPVAEVTP